MVILRKRLVTLTFAQASSRNSEENMRSQGGIGRLGAAGGQGRRAAIKGAGLGISGRVKGRMRAATGIASANGTGG